MRNLPRHFPWVRRSALWLSSQLVVTFLQNSVYSLYSFFTPDHMKQSLTRQGLQDKYTFDPPIATPVPKVLNTVTGIRNVFNDPSRFKVIYEKYGYGSILMFDDVAKYVHDCVIFALSYS